MIERARAKAGREQGIRVIERARASRTNLDDGAGGADSGADGGAAIAQLATAATEAALLHAFDAILAAASTPAAMAFSAVTSLSLRRKKEVGGAVWTKRVAAAYGGMLREIKRVEAAAPSAPPLALAGVGRALFTRAVSTSFFRRRRWWHGGRRGEPGRLRRTACEDPTAPRVRRRQGGAHRGVSVCWVR
jgi:hypothetical protein